ncbi:MAG: hypothetical protein ABL912_02020 [Novosphingobium sp.]
MTEKEIAALVASLPEGDDLAAMMALIQILEDLAQSGGPRARQFARNWLDELSGSG